MSYHRGYRSGHDNRNGSGSYYNRREPNKLHHQAQREPENHSNLTKDVSRSQVHSGVSSVTNAASNVSSLRRADNENLGQGEGVLQQSDTLTADEKRKLRQAKLAKWKQKQGTPESTVAEKKPLIAKINKPIIQKKGQLKVLSVKNGRSLFDEELETSETEGVNFKQLKRQKLKPTVEGPREEENGDEDPLEAYMVRMADSDDSNRDSAKNSELIEEELANDAGDLDEENEDFVIDLLNQSNNIHKAKEIPVLAPSQREITKKFYDFSLNSLKEDDIHEFTELNQITVKPDDGTIRPVKEFGQLGLTSKMLETLTELNFTEPTPIQKIALPVLMSGHDVIAVAKTGSGKTLAFVLPMIRHIVANLSSGKRSNQTPIGLILTPTRELALQIFKDCKPFLKSLDLRGVCCYGGSNISSQIAELKKGAELVICTPGRMIDLLTANGGRVTNLTEVSSLVLDEADRMFDLGFEPQIMKIIKNVRSDRQTCLFSATFAKKIENLATKVLRDPIQIIVGGGRSIVSDTITQRVMVVRPEDKIFRLLKILGEFITEDEPNKKVLIFCSTQDRCDNLLSQLLQRGYKGLSIHGGKDQVDRDGAIHDFQKGSISILVATSIAARGLDVKDLGIVINYDSPNHMEDYVHRVGRTGRAGKTGIAYTFVEPSEERSANDIAKALKLSKNIVPQEISTLAEKFQDKLKEGKEKFSSGFGGKGLEKLNETRAKTQNMERKAHGADEIDDRPPLATIGVDSPKDEPEISAIDFSVIDGPVPGKLDSRLFHSKIYINDLPQKARVFLSQQYPTIVEQTNVSITTKGTFVLDTNSKEDKLHILVESDDRMDVVNAVSMVKSAVIEGIKGSNEEELRKLRHGGSGKYTV